METSEQLDKLYTALATAQGTIQSAKKDAINPFFKKSYATLDSIWNAIRLPLSTNELSVIQIPIKDQGGLKLITRLCHSSGQWMQGVFEIQPSKDDLQAIGSALTYARRYALAAMVGVTADEDDDGNNEPATEKESNPKNNKTEQPTTNGNNGQSFSEGRLLAELNRVQGLNGYYKDTAELETAIKAIMKTDTWQWPNTAKEHIGEWRQLFKKVKDHALEQLEMNQEAS